MMNRLSTWPLPFRILNTSRDLDEMFSRFLGDWEQDRMPRHAVPTEYVPQIASYVDGNSICIRADLPGVDPQEVELTVKENQLTLKGERKAEQEQQNGNRLSQEVQYGAFARTFTLPEGYLAPAGAARRQTLSAAHRQKLPPGFVLIGSGARRRERKRAR